MGIWNSFNPDSIHTSASERRKVREERNRQRKRRRGGAKRASRLEQFEPRNLLAGPELISIIPNAGDVLLDGQIRHSAPRELTIRFNQGQVIDPTTLGGIQIVRGGVDRVIGTPDDVSVVPGFAGIGKRANEVVVRFAETLPDDNYRITLVGAGAAPIKNDAGEPFHAGRNLTLDFRLDLGALVVAVVPQPITRDAFGGLQQATNKIDVYFNNDDLRTISANKLDPKFFQLIRTKNTATNTDDGAAIIPTSVDYDATTDKATLTFAQDLGNFGAGAYRLRIGNDDAPLPAPAPTNLAVDPGSTFTDATSPPNDLGVLNSQSKVVTQEISVVPIVPGLIFPGGNNEVGHREIPVAGEDHLTGPLDPHGAGGVPKLYYNFQDIYGFDPDGNPLHNVITDVQKIRTREIFELISHFAGVQFIESDHSGFTIATGDPRAVDPKVPSGVTGIPGIAGGSNGVGPTAVVNAGFNWGDSEYGGNWFRTAFHEIQHLLGLGHAYDLPSLTVQGNEGENGPGAGELVFPGDADITHMQFLYRREGNDIDMYKFELDQAGQVNIQTFAERLADSSHLNSLLTLYNEATSLVIPAAGGAAIVDGQKFTITGGGVTKTFEFNSSGGVAGGAIEIKYIASGPNVSAPRDLAKAMAEAINASGLNVSADFSLDRVIVRGPVTVNAAGAPALSALVDRQVVARNDDYYGKDSYIQLKLQPGRYYIGVTSTGNLNFDPNLKNSGFAGTTSGGYELRVDFKPNPNLTDAAHNQLDTTGTAFDGDNDGVPGGAYDFWFRVGPTLYVDKSAAGGGDGSLASPYNNIPEALRFAGNRMIAPAAGAAAIKDGDTFKISDDFHTVIFEFDNDNALNDLNHVQVKFTAGDVSANDIAVRMVDAINSVGFFTATHNAFAPQFIDLSGLVTIDVRGTASLIDATKIVRIVGNVGPDNSLQVRSTPGILDGQSFQVAAGARSLIFEFDRVGGVSAGNVAVPFTLGSTAADIVAAMALAINNSSLGNLGGGTIFATVAAGTTRVDLVSVQPISLDAKGAPNLIAVSNANPYQIGTDAFGSVLPDGITVEIPQAVTLMIDAGAVFKLFGANIDAGSSSQNVDRSRGAIQVLGTPKQSVFFTSFNDPAVGVDTNPLGVGPQRGEWGGLVFRDDSDLESEGVFVNYVNHADIRFGGGQVEVNSVRSVFNPVHMVTSRPTVSYNVITDSADAALSADPNSFEDTKFESNVPGAAYTADYDRVGPKIVGNRFVSQRNNFDSGLTIVAPPAVNADGTQISDGMTFTIDGQQFEFNSTGGVLAKSIAIPFTSASSSTDIATAIANAVNGAKLGAPPVRAIVVGDKVTFLNARSISPLAIDAAPGNQLRDGQLFTVNGVTFEFDSAGGVTVGNRAVAFKTTDTASVVAASIGAAINAAGLGVFAGVGGTRVNVMNAVSVDVPAPLVLSILTSIQLTTPAGSALADGQTFRVNNVTFEFNSTGGVSGTNVPVPFKPDSTSAQVATAMTTAINGSTSGAQAFSFSNFLFVRGASSLIANAPLAYGSPNLSLKLTSPVTLTHDNTINGLFVRIRTLAGRPIDTLDVPARFDDVDVVHVLSETLIVSGTPGGPTLDPVTGKLHARLDARLAVDPALIVKFLGSRIETGVGGQFIAEATPGNEITFTSLHDDRYGAGGTFDTDGDIRSVVPPPAKPAEGDWAGLFFGPTSKASIDRVLVTFAGGNTAIEGGFDKFNPVEILQADVRITNSTFERNAGGLAATNRNGRGGNASSTVFIRGAQPILVGNVFKDNLGEAIDVNVNSLNSFLHGDYGRSIGFTEAYGGFDNNRGPLVRLNKLGNNFINGMVVRGGELTTQGVWDDTDIVHVVRDEIEVPNFHTYGGLRLESSPTASLVIKLSGTNAGFTAGGVPLDIDDRIGGSVQVIGAPGHAVILTGLTDDDVGAGLTPDDQPQNNTDNTESKFNKVGTAGPVFIDGGDRDDHGSFSNGVNQDGWKFIEQAVNFTYSTALNTAGVGILAIGVTGGQAGDAINSAAAVLGLPAPTFVTGAAISTVNFNQFRIIYIPSDDSDTGGGISDADIALLTARKNEIQNYVNKVGGGFIALTEASAATPYAFLELPLPFVINTNITGGSNLKQTPLLAAAGFNITDAELNNGTPWHNEFIGPPGFNNLQVWVVSTANEVVTLGLPAGSAGIGGRDGGEWRSIKLDKYGNDRNVDLVNETENPYTGSRGINDTPDTAQFLGNLAPNEKGGDDRLRLGYEVHGFVSLDDPRDVDLYSFKALTGTEAWFDIDRTSQALDSILEIVDSTGTVLARSDNSVYETAAADPNAKNPNPLLQGLLAGNLARPLQKDVLLGKLYGANDLRDFNTTNPLDAGLRMILPGKAGATNTYYVRVRSAGPNINSLTGGVTKGEYQLQVRLREIDEVPGSTVRGSDIRFATRGVEVLGSPGHSPLVGESAEKPGDANNEGQANALDVGNLLTADRNTISVAGSLATPTDVDWYKFTVDYDLIQVLQGVNDTGKSWSTIFDIDYADGIARPDTIMSVYDAQGRLLLVSRDSNVADDQPRPTSGADTSNLASGGFGKLDPYIGSVQLPEGTSRTYFVAISSNAILPSALDATFRAGATNSLIRLEPVNSTKRIVEDHIGFTGYTTGDKLDLNKTQVVDHTNVDPQTGKSAPLVRIDDAQKLATYIRPFSLGDVTLFVSTGADFNKPSFLTAVNPSTGKTEVVNIGNFAPDGTDSSRMWDLAMRSDGRLFGYRDETGANVGERMEINAGDASVVNPDVNGDGVDDDGINPTQLGGFHPDALAWDHLGLNSWNLWYSARNERFTDDSLNMSYLYFANPVDGSISPTPPFGLVGADVNKPIITAVAATHLTDFTGLHDITDGQLITVNDGINPTTVFEWQSGRQITTVDGALMPTVTLFTISNSPRGPSPLVFEVVNTDKPPGVPIDPVNHVIVFIDDGDLAEDVAGKIAAAINAPFLNGQPVVLDVTATTVRNRVLVINTFNNFGPDVDGEAPLVFSGTSDFDPAHVPIKFFANDTRIVIADRIANAISAVGPTLNATAEHIPVPNSRWVQIENSQLAQVDIPLRLIGTGPGGPMSGMATLPSSNPAEGSTMYGVSANGGFYRMFAQDGVDPITEVDTALVGLFPAGVYVHPQYIDPRGGSLFGPSDTTFGPDGNLYVTSRETNEVLRYDGFTGEFIDTFVRRSSGGLDHPEALVFGPDGNLYVASYGMDDIIATPPAPQVAGRESQILKYDGKTGAFLGVFVNQNLLANGRLMGATGLTFGPNGNLFVSSFLNNRVLEYKGDGGALIATFVSPGDGGLAGPMHGVFGPDVNNDGVQDFYLTSYLTDRVIVYNGLTGKINEGQAIKDFVASKSGGLGRPDGISFGPDGDLYVTSILNTSIQKYGGVSQRGAAVLRYNGFTGAFVEAFTQGADDLSRPQSVTFGPNGDLFVAAYGNDQVLRYDGTNGTFESRFVRDRDASENGPLWATEGNRYGGLALGPQNLDFDGDGIGGDLQRVLFAVGSANGEGKLVGFNERGDTLRLFDTLGTGILQPSAKLAVPDATGLAFSVLDFNLWHPTMRATAEPGHGINPAFDNSRHNPADFEHDINGRVTNEAAGGASLRFGIDKWSADPANNEFLSYGVNAQFGINDPKLHAELYFNPEILDTYNLPGGAHGSLMTDPFNLEGYSNFDRPTLYFNYKLQTQGRNDAGKKMLDAARVFLSQDGGRTWELLATNNSVLDAELPKFLTTNAIVDVVNPDKRQRVQELFETNNWRQARIDLGDYAGRKNLRLRFDFSTSGQVESNGSAEPDSRFRDYPNSKFGDFTSGARGLDNRFDGFSIDDIIVGLAERGEMVTGAVANQNQVNFAVPVNPNFNAPKQVLTGAYQLEVRRGEEFTLNGGATIVRDNTTIQVAPQDTNIRDASAFTLFAPGVFSGTIDKLPNNLAPLDFQFNNTPNPNGTNGNQVVGYLVVTAIGDLEAIDEFLTLEGIGAPSLKQDLFVNDGKFEEIVTRRVDLTLAQLQAMRSPGGQMIVRLTPSAAVSGLRNVNVRLDFGGKETTVQDGDSFLVSDGVNKLIFEFDSNGSLQTPQPPTGPVAVRGITVTGLEDASTLAAKIATAINQAKSAGLFDVTASITTEDNLNSFVNPNANQAGRIDIYGAAAIDTRLAPRLGSPAGFFADGTARPWERRGDRNLFRDQGQIIIQGNRISDPLEFGVDVGPGQRDANNGLPHPGAVRNTTVLNNERQAPGVTIENNLIVAGGGKGGIRFQGDPNLNGAPVASVPFGRIVNNTIVGQSNKHGVGIQVAQNASPTILNNILAGLITGVTIDASSSTSVLGTTIYQNNTTNAAIGSVIENFRIALAANDPLFLDAAARNFYLAAGSKAIDSSIDTLQDRAALVNVKQPLGISPSPILAPDTDVYNQLRVDDPNVTPPPGLGANVFKDRGAIERADTLGPNVVLLNPRDNDLLDQDAAVNTVHLIDQSVTQFTVQLVDPIGVGIDPQTVIGARFILRRNGFKLTNGVDYIFSYDANNNVVRFIAAAGIWLNGSVFTLAIDNGVKFENETPVGIRDLAGNLLRPNEPTGDTRFSIFLDSSVNDPPELSLPGPLTTPEDTLLVMSKLNFTNISVFDVDAANLPVKVTLTSLQGVLSLATTSGLASVVGNGTGTLVFVGPLTAVNAALDGLTFLPNLNFNGPATIDVLIDDQGNTGTGGPKTASGVIDIDVTPVNDPPVVTGGLSDITVAEDSPPIVLDLSGVFDDVDILTNGDVLSYSVKVSANPSLVKATQNGTTLTLTLGPNQNGKATVTVRATDQAGAFAETSFVLTVTPVNDPPTVKNKIADVAVDEDAPPTNIDLTNTFDDVDILTNADVLTLTVSGNTNTTLLSTKIQGKTLTLTYLPDANGVATITVRATDLAGAFVQTSFKVTVRPINDAPRPVGDEFVFDRNTTLTVQPAGVLTNDVDVDGDPLSAILFDVPAHGKLSLNANGSFTYVPDPGFNGLDSFVYKADDGQVRVAATVQLKSLDYRWVERMYKEVLLRPSLPSEKEVMFWVGNLDKGQSRLSIAQNFVTSVERRSRIINDLYNAYLGRNVDSGGLAYWLSVWAANNGPEKVQAGIIGSLEYFVKSGATPANPAPWVKALYKNLLNRDPSASELADWTAIVLKGASREQVVIGFVTSDEYRLNLIGSFYTTFLKRTIDAGGAQFWLQQMKNGLSQETILSGILASEEYRLRA